MGVCFTDCGAEVSATWRDLSGFLCLLMASVGMPCDVVTQPSHLVCPPASAALGPGWCWWIFGEEAPFVVRWAVPLVGSPSHEE